MPAYNLGKNISRWISSSRTAQINFIGCLFIINLDTRNHPTRNIHLTLSSESQEKRPAFVIVEGVKPYPVSHPPPPPPPHLTKQIKIVFCVNVKKRRHRDKLQWSHGVFLLVQHNDSWSMIYIQKSIQSIWWIASVKMKIAWVLLISR